MKLLRDWLANHILNDKKYTKCFNDHGLKYIPVLAWTHASKNFTQGAAPPLLFFSLFHKPIFVPSYLAITSSIHYNTPGGKGSSGDYENITELLMDKRSSTTR
jgi:hypothetical protein